MHEGDRAQIWVPAALAYPGHAEGPRGALRIDVELLAILRSEGEPEPTQGPQLRPPPNALFTATGLSFLVLREGSGTRHPGPQTTVTVHYEGWTSDGKSFDSSRARGRPASFRLDRVIAGWQEGVQLMVEGETTRFWIPAELAYGNKPGRPQGMLIFDVELISIDD
ncbi:MAG: FKBP-type peptidyl-prolyl cis-trans isomerase [Myxococcales bacterium]|nr:FKBP-type peptidyl-prolyl cis-trans isomerase [Myxococcales bacterium]